MTDLSGVLRRLGSPRLLVLGDLMLDRYAWGEAERVSPEGPALVLRSAREEAWPGGAGAVARMAAGLGARVSVAGVVGEDADGRELLGLLDRAGIDREGVLRVDDRPTTCKARFAAHLDGRRSQQLLRFDREGRAPLHAADLARLAGAAGRGLDECDVALIADHDKGAWSAGLMGHVLREAARRGVPVLVDPARRADWERYRGAELLAPNRAEAALASGRAVGSPHDALAAARALGEQTGAAVLVKLDCEGMVLAAGEEEVVCRASAHEVVDVTGAGDVVLAVLGLCRAAGVGWGDGARLAALAAGLEVRRWGAKPVGREELAAEARREAGPGGKVVTLAEMAALAEGYRQRGKTVVLTNGCFDLLHAGHAAYLEEAARLGWALVVAINDDAGVRRLKGEGRPIIGQADRAALVAALGCVRHVLLFADDTPHEVIRRVRPDVLVKGGDYAPDRVVGREVVEGYGGRVCVTGRREGLSTTQVRSRVLRGSLVGVED